jgi:hypothetical protein
MNWPGATLAGGGEYEPSPEHPEVKRLRLYQGSPERRSVNPSQSAEKIIDTAEANRLAHPEACRPDHTFTSRERKLLRVP